MVKSGDIMFDADGVMIIKDGDLVFGDANGTLQKRLITTEKGENKSAPLWGIGINSWLLSEADGQDLKKEFQGQYENDGLRIISLNFKEEGIEPEAIYVR